MRSLTLRVFGSFGIIVFLPLFLFTFLDPQLIEKSGSSFIEWKLQSKMSSKIESIKLPESTKLEKFLGKRAEKLRAQTETKLALVKSDLQNDVPKIMAEQLAKIRDLDCECRKKWETWLTKSMNIELASLERAKVKLAEFTQMKYMEIVTKLTRDVRIFIGANGLIFLFLLLASFMKPAAIRHLFLPSGLMLISSVICSYFYIFEQNWLYTIIYSSYTGFAYIGYLSLVFAILSDIVFNKARVTTEIINGFLQAIGQVGNLVPC